MLWPSGVGKTLSARRYASWKELLPILRQRPRFLGPETNPAWHTLFFTPMLQSTPRVIDKELCDLSDRLAVARMSDLNDPRLRSKPHGSAGVVELLVVDEADRLKMPALEQLGDHTIEASSG